MESVVAYPIPDVPPTTRMTWGFEVMVFEENLGQSARMTEYELGSDDVEGLKLVHFETARVETCPALNPKLAKLGGSLREVR